MSDVVVDESTARAAERYLRSLPDDWRAPQIAPDGDGGVYVAWDDELVIVGLGEGEIYCVYRAGTPESRHYEGIPFS
jgi:hypothetical protein